MKKDFIAAGHGFFVGNTRVVDSDVVVQETDPFGQHATLLSFDGQLQLLYSSKA